MDLSKGAVLLNGALERPSDVESESKLGFVHRRSVFERPQQKPQSGFVHRCGVSEPRNGGFVSRRGVLDRVFEAK